MSEKTKKVIFVVGPTASGKTGIGVSLAKDLDGEIISADSRQVYRGLDIGTGKDLNEYNGVKYHLIDICDPGKRFTLFDHLPLARAAIEDICNRGKVPIVVGGTGLYIQGLVEGFQLKPISSTSKQSVSYPRKELENFTLEHLKKILKEIDSEAYRKVDQNNSHRLIRAIERAQEGSIPAKEGPDFDVLEIGITWPRDVLHERIDKRVDERFDQGMLEEVAGLLDKGVDPEWLIGLGLEYRVITKFLISNKVPSTKIAELKKIKEFGEMKQELKWKIHQFARRQLTWFRRFPEIYWTNDYKEVEREAKRFLKDS